jgi:hypothetical protein
MFRMNAFGQRIPCNPRLVFHSDPSAPPSGGNPADQPVDQPVDHGYPQNTPLEQMTAEQREAYWKHQARKHESTVKARQDYDQLKADSEELARVRAANATDEEKAREEARREGENIGAARYLKQAVMGSFQGLTGKTKDEIDTIFAHVDPSTFTDDKGDIDTDALEKYAATFGAKDGANIPPTDPVRAALERTQNPGAAGGGGGGSIAELKQQRKEKLQKSK